MVDIYKEEQQAIIKSNIKIDLLHESDRDNCHNFERKIEIKADSGNDSESTCLKSFKLNHLTNDNFGREWIELPEKNLTAIMEHIANNSSENEPFFIFDVNSVVSQYAEWNLKLPRFTPFYAVKCNPEPKVLETLISLGTSFDCASLEEIKTILNYGISPEKIIFANPCKSVPYLKYAAEKGVNKMTFDNSDELYKIKKIYPKAQLVIRIQVDDSKSHYKLGLKFGVPLGKTRILLELAKNLELDVIGVSFHVGSSCGDSYCFADAIKRARDVFKEGEELGFKFSLLDIGGGFPAKSEGQYGVNDFETIANVINKAYDRYFREYSDLTLIAEPGRYFVSSAFSLTTNITSRRCIYTEEGKSYMYYLNDGVYGSFNIILFGEKIIFPKFLIRNPLTDQVNYTSAELMDQSNFVDCSIWGPTCDSNDCLSKSLKMPELNLGDWLIFENMGAYTLACSTKFNGISLAKVYYFNTDSDLADKDDLMNPNSKIENRAWLTKEGVFS